MELESRIAETDHPSAEGRLIASHPHLSDYRLCFETLDEKRLLQPIERLFAENETNARRLHGAKGAAISKMLSMITSSTKSRMQ